MGPALTVAFPTYNRAALLDRQLGWLSRALAGHEQECEILVSDNSSPDETPGVVERWRQALGERQGQPPRQERRSDQEHRLLHRLGTQPPRLDRGRRRRDR